MDWLTLINDRENIDMEKKLLYILNHYSENSVEHFFHVIHLLEKVADNNVEIVLIIEKCEGKPRIDNPNIKIVAQKETNKCKRVLELNKILSHYIDMGYKKIFVRISTNAAIIAIRQARHKKAEVYFWQSGDNITYDLQKRGLDKIKYLLFGYTKLKYIKTYVNYFVTGPETMIEYYINALRIKREKMLLLYNDIDIERFQRCSAEEKLALRGKMGIASEKKVVLFVHRFTPVKRFYLQLPYVIEQEEFCRLNTLLIVVGTGPDYDKIKGQVENSQYGDMVRMIGAVPNKEIMDYYKIADVFINPSYSEGFPRVVIEAMASGLPVVATNVGGTCDIIGDKQKKYIVDKDNREAFRKCLLCLLQDEKLRKQISDENLQHVKKYSTEAVANMYIERIFN